MNIESPVFVFLCKWTVLLALAWSVAAPVLVMERTGVLGAFTRSAELTRNHRVAIFALAILAAVIGFMIQALATGIVMGGALSMANVTTAGGGGMIGVVIAQAATTLVAQTINALIGSAGVASVYYELRFVKEGVGAEQLAAVFD